MGVDSPPSPTLCSPPHRIRQQGSEPNSQVLSATILLCSVRLLRERMRSVRPQPSLLFGFLPRHRPFQGRSYGRRHLSTLRARPSQDAARQRLLARQRAKQLAAPSTPGVCFNARLRRHTLDSRIVSPQASIPIAACESKREARAQCSQDGPTASLRTGSTPGPATRTRALLLRLRSTPAASG